MAMNGRYPLPLYAEVREQNHQMLLANLGLAYHAAFSVLQDASSADRDDAIQEATICLIDCIKKFDPRKEVKLSSYAFHAMQRRVKLWWVRHRRCGMTYVGDSSRCTHGYYTPMEQQPLSLDFRLDDNTPPLSSSLPAREDHYPATIDRDKLDKLMSEVLSPTQRMVIEMRLAGKNFDEIGEFLGGKSKQGMHGAWIKACKLLREACGGVMEEVLV